MEDPKYRLNSERSYKSSKPVEDRKEETGEVIRRTDDTREQNDKDLLETAIRNSLMGGSSV
jgi:hypothetical protein